MRQDLLLSFLLHFIIVISLVVVTPFKPRLKINPGDVISVHLASMPAGQAQKAEPAVIPKAKAAEEPLAMVPDKKPSEKAKPIEKPKKEKEKAKDKSRKAASEQGTENVPGSEEGLKDVSGNLGPGSRFGGAAIDNASFDYPYWFVQSFAKIERNWTNPIYSSKPLKCVIYFQIIRSGRIAKIEIEESSGIDAFDNACERAVKMSQPLPPLPSEFTDEIIGIHLEFPYTPR